MAAEKLELFQQIFGIDEDVVKEKETLAQSSERTFESQSGTKQNSTATT